MLNEKRILVCYYLKVNSTGVLDILIKIDYSVVVQSFGLLYNFQKFTICPYFPLHTLRCNSPSKNGST